MTFNPRWRPGVGTAGNLPLWTNGPALADSIVSESAGVVSIAGGLAVDTDTLYVDYLNDFVGINTSAPIGMLSCRGPAGQVGFDYGSLPAPDRGNLFYDTDGTGWKFHIGKVQGGVFSPQMSFVDTGRVGINEQTPDYLLDINGAIGFTPGASVTPVDNGDIVFQFTSNTSITLKGKGSDGVVRSANIAIA